MTTTPSPMSGPGGPVAPPGARFDPVTGAELTSGGSERKGSFALQPGEPVMSFNMVTSLMPLASGSAPQTYRWALGLGLLVPVIAGALGFLAFAFVAAALLVPAIYVVYMYDVNEWEDQPIGVVLGAIGAAAVLGAGFTLVWHAGLLDGNAAAVDLGGSGVNVRWSSLLVLVLLVPVVSELLKQVGPLFLAGRPQFDDLIDAMTFGVAAGASFAAAETIVVNRSLFHSFGSIDHPNAGFWVSLIVSAAIVKPIVYGAATGIALAAYSGIGSGYDGFKPAYFRGLGEALLANIAFQAGLYFAARIEGTAGTLVGLVWGALIAAVLVVRLRYLLHYAVLEAALEGASSGTVHRDAARGTAYCPSCEMPLLHGANFCVVCGTATRAGNKVSRTRNRTEDELVAPTRSVRPTPVGTAPQDNKGTALVVGAVLAVIVIGGGIAQGVSAAADDQGEVGGDPRITTVPRVGSGPVTEEPATPADPPGPDPSPSVSSEDGTANRAPFGGIYVHADDGGIGGNDGTGTDDGSGGIGGSDGTGTDDGGGVATALGVVDLGNGVGFAIPDGWEADVNQPGFAQLFGQNGYFIAVTYPSPTDVTEMVTDNMKGLVDFGVQELEYTKPEANGLPSSSVVDSQYLQFRGVMASQQGGTFPVNGQAFYFVTQDGTGYTAFALYAEGELERTPQLLADCNEMLNGLVGSF